MAEPYDWTLAIYVAADNNLASKAQTLLAEIKSYRRSPKLRIVIAVDESNGPTVIYDLFDANSQTKLTINDNLDFGSSDPLRALLEYAARTPYGKQDEPFGTLTEFLSWVQERSLLRTPMRAGLIIWNHGGGWDQVASDTNPGLSKLSVIEVQKALNGSALPRPSFIGFDACLTSTLEVLSQLKDNTDVVICSQALAPASGWDYADLVAKLSATPPVEPYDLALSVVQSFQAKTTKQLGHGTLVAIDISKLAPLLRAFSALATNVMQQGANAKALASLRDKMLTLYNPEYVDVQSLLDVVAREFPSVDTGTVTQALADVFVTKPAPLTPKTSTQAAKPLQAKAIFGSRNSNKSGISVYYPKYKGPALATYGDLDFSTEWLKFLKANVTTSIIRPDPYP